tara:strand:+ start:2203 stop:2610 length:408 start_codon:yes stop_codon:yes gene_type:complete
MLLEHFDKCSDLKNFTDKTVTHRELEGVSSEDIDKCSQLGEVINEHNNYLYLYNNNDSNNLENPINNLNFDIKKIINLEDLKSKQIYIYIIMALVVNFYLSLFIAPIVFSGSILISLCIVLLSILILFLLMYLFS